MAFVRASRNTDPVPTEVVSAMRSAFTKEDGTDIKTKAIAMLQVADRSPTRSDYGYVLMDCILSTRPVMLTTNKIDWLNACIVSQQTSLGKIDVDWIALAVQNSCSDDLIEWLVHSAKEPVSERALECACRNDWWKTTLPILLTSKNFAQSEIELKYSVLHPEQLAVLPAQFFGVGLNLCLCVHAWTCTAANAVNVAESDEDLAAVRWRMEPLFTRSGDQTLMVEHLGGNYKKDGWEVSLSELFGKKPSQGIDVGAHLECECWSRADGRLQWWFNETLISFLVFKCAKNDRRLSRWRGFGYVG